MIVFFGSKHRQTKASEAVGCLMSFVFIGVFNITFLNTFMSLFVLNYSIKLENYSAEHLSKMVVG